MKPYLLALVAAAAVLPGCAKNLGAPQRAGMSKACNPVKVEVATDPVDQAADGADLLFAFSPGAKAVDYPARLLFVNSTSGCVTRIFDIPPQSIPTWQQKMSDRVTSVFNGPRPPPPPPVGDPKLSDLDDLANVSRILGHLQM